MSGKRIGRKMAQVADAVSRCPGETKMSIAAWIGPHGSLKYGYAIVDRAIKAGLVVATERNDKRGAYRLWPRA